MDKADSTSFQPPRARAWFLIAQFDVAVHMRFANSNTDQIFPEYIRELIDSRRSYLDSRLKGMNFISYSVPRTLSSLQNRGVVTMDGIFHGSHVVSQHTVQGLFDSVDGLTASWGALYFGPGEAWPSLNDHAAYKTYLRESSLGGLNPALMFRVDYRGVSEAMQPTIWREEARAKAWRFEAKIDAVQHVDLFHDWGEIRSDYFHLNILQRITNWETIQKVWDLISYSVQRNIISEHARDSVPVVGYFRHVSHGIRQKEVQSMLDGIPGLTVNWHAVRLGHGSSLASNTDYQEFLAASTKAEDGADSNQNLWIRVDVQGSSDAAPKKRGAKAGSKPIRPALASLDSLINSVGALDTLPTFRFLDDPAAKRPKPTAARAPPVPTPAAARPAPTPAQVRNSPPRSPAP